jgi:hypothetical protein
MTCDISPPDFTTELGKVRYYSGDRTLNENGQYIIPDAVILEILDMYADKPSSWRVYYATLDTLLMMKTTFAPYAARSREREGSVEVELYGNERYQNICDLYDWFRKKPDIIVKDAVQGSIIIGGVRIDKYCDVLTDANGLYKGSRIDDIYKVPVTSKAHKQP